MFLRGSAKPYVKEMGTNDLGHKNWKLFGVILYPPME